jgi:hypothetical protein
MSLPETLGLSHREAPQADARVRLTRTACSRHRLRWSLVRSLPSPTSGIS